MLDDDMWVYFPVDINIGESESKDTSSAKAPASLNPSVNTKNASKDQQSSELTTTYEQGKYH